MEIRGVPGRVGPISTSQPVSAQGSDKPTPLGIGGGDEVTISPAATYLHRIRELPDVRTDKVDAARRSIAAGQMDTDEKLSIAIDRLLDDLLN